MKKLNTGVEQRGARQTLQLIKDNVMGFKLSDQFMKKVNSFYSQKKDFTDNQLSYIDGLYEKYMRFGNLPSIKVKHDNKKRYV